MTKDEVAQRVLRNGKPLPVDWFTWDAKCSSFLTNVGGLRFDFSDLSHMSFRTGASCHFVTRGACSFETLTNCSFVTGRCCRFMTYGSCRFSTDAMCYFNTGNDCRFKAGNNCRFFTGKRCQWEIDGIFYPFPPLWFNGSCYSIGFDRPGIVRSGCISKPLQWWQEHITECAERYGYTCQQVREYRFYVKLLSEWAMLNGWNKVVVAAETAEEE